MHGSAADFGSTDRATMKLKHKLLAGIGVIFSILTVLALMNIALYLKVLDNIGVRDEERRALNDLKECVEWRNNLNRRILEMLAVGHVPPEADAWLSPPETVNDCHMSLMHEMRPLVRAVQAKSDKITLVEKQFEASRKEIISIYHQLDQSIATVLAVIQMERVLGNNNTSNEEKSALAPYVLKSLNQLTLIALNSLVTRQYAENDRQTVGLNRKFLTSQLRIIDDDKRLAALFARLFEQIEAIDRLLPETAQAMNRLDGQISKHEAAFKRAMDDFDGGHSVLASKKKAQLADESLETTSRNILIASVLLMFVVPLLVMLIGVHRLNRILVEPITELMRTMEKFEQGRMDTEAPVRGVDEIRVLSRSFNAMARQIKGKVEELAFINRALTENERRLKAILESSANPILVCDTTGRIEYANPAFTDVFGWKSGEVKGESAAFFVSKDSEDISEARFSELYQRRTPVKFMVGWLTVDERCLDVIVSAALIIGEEEMAQGMVINLTDISEQKSLEAQLIQAQKMESVGRLAGGVAHDYNNMLAVIVGRADMALEKAPPDHPLYHDLKQILSAATRSIDITRQLLAFSRKQTISPKRLDFNATIESMLKMLRHLIGENIKLNWRPGDAVWDVWMDASQIDQILMNLCVNARDAISERGTISIETGNAEFDEDYCARHPEALPGAFVMLSVSDDGCGIDKNLQKQIFEPFFTTKRQGEGTGLGLSTVYGIVKQNNGFINCYSERGYGTTFRIYIHPHTSKPDTQCTQNEVSDVSVSGRATILLVEDEAILLEMTHAMLTQLGHVVIPATTSGDAISIAEKGDQKIDLLITDVVMPDLNGKELAETLLKIRKDLQVLYISGYPAAAITHRGVLDEHVNFLAKPFTRNELATKVKETLESRIA